MSKNKKKGGVTLANIIAVVGLVLLMVFTYVGHSYKSGGETGMDILVAVAITAFAALLLWFLIKAKGAENQISLWKKVEIATLAAYILFAIPASLFSGIMQFFVVNSARDEAKQIAKSELNAVDSILIVYNDSVNNWIGKTRIGMENSLRPGQERDNSLSEYMRGLTQNGSDEFEETNKKQYLINDSYNKNFYNEYNSERERIEQIVDDWKIFKLPQISKAIDSHAKKLCDALNKNIERANFPYIVKDGSTGKFKIVKKQNDNFRLQPKESSAFQERLSRPGFSVMAIVLVLIIHLLILFNYIVAYRTHTVGVGKYSSEDGANRL